MGARIIIVGSGFAGMTLAEYLTRHVARDLEVVVISSENHMVFTPMLAEVVGRSLSPLDVVMPGRQMAPRATWLTATVNGVDLKRNEVEFTRPDGKTATLSYTHLVLACGSAVNLDAVPGMAAHAYTLRTVGDGMVLGNELIGRFEQAAVEPDAGERRRLLTVVVIGGGFTGVEAAGHMFDLMRNIKPFYPQLSHDRPRMVLVQRGPKIVPEFQHDSLSEFALRKLRANGLDVRLGTGVQEVTARYVRVDGVLDLQRLRSRCYPLERLDGNSGDSHLHPRFHRSGRRWAHAPTGGAFDVSTGHPRINHSAAGGCQRGG
jgi:NADH:quinone reductase (non-electrogenic)